MIDVARAGRIFALFQELRLLTAREVRAISSLLDGGFAFADVLARADSLHVHGRVDDVASMPHAQIKAAGAAVENQKDGYVKYAFPGGVNMIYSSIDVAEDDRLGERAGAPPRPFVDHVGIDLRQETAELRSLFDAVPARARALGWRHVAQGDDTHPVFCCHTSVGLKHWVYPGAASPFSRPIELAYGALTIHAGKMGCDLRPIDPAHPLAAQAVCGAHAVGSDAGAPAGGDPHGGYYDRADLGRFAEVGGFARETWDRFLAYYSHATGTDGALTRREKALIALAVAHSKQCPYCIDAYTGTCLETGASVEQMHEAVHVAAAMAAGVDLAHATQMHGALRRHKAI